MSEYRELGAEKEALRGEKKEERHGEQLAVGVCQSCRKKCTHDVESKESTER